MTGLRRVVVTGIGMVTPLGTGTQRAWGRLLDGRSGIRGLGESYDKLPSRVAGVVQDGKDEGDFDIDQWVDKGLQGSTSRFIHFALSASEQALADSGWRPTTDEQKFRTGVAFGSGLGCLHETRANAVMMEKSGHRRISPYAVPKMLINLASGQVSIKHGFMGPNHAVATACAAGTNAIGDASRFIQFGDADVMVCGGSEAVIAPMSIGMFSRSRSLSTLYNDDPEAASRPFDSDRDGFVIAEGAACLVLEELEHAKARGAPIYAEVLGYGTTACAHHVTAPSPDGSGAYRCMQNALRHGHIHPDEVGYVNAHATSTPVGDAIENIAIERLFGTNRNTVNAPHLRVSSTKGATGHALGASGAIEAAFTVLALHERSVPPTRNLHNPDPAFNLDYVSHTAQQLPELTTAVTNSFGFGGVNASLVFSTRNL